MHEATKKGMVFGGMLNRSKTACLPYEFEPCEHPCQGGESPFPEPSRQIPPARPTR